MATGCHGGKWALAGFLYQIVGMASIMARALAPAVISSGDESDEVDALVALIGDGEELQAGHEQLGQDAIFTTDDEYVIAQFKYSSTGRKITRGELVKIIRKLEHSADQAASLGENVTACALVTNRDFTRRGRAAEQLWEDEQGRQRDYELRHWLVSLGGLERKVREFGADYGLFDREIEGGVDKLVGRVFRQTVEPFGASIGRDHVVESFTGYRHAERLTIAAVAPKCYAELQRFGASIRVDQWNDTPLRRDVFDHIVEAINERALVSIYGKGGCGKSIILWQLLRQLYDQPGGCFTVRLAKDLPDSWITKTVHAWRNLPPGNQPSDDRQDAISRLQIANPGVSKQIFWLALDGLDEGVGPDQRSYVQEIAQWFWTKDRESQESGQLPSATLVVSFRRKEDLDQAWLNLPYDYPGERPLAVPVGDFSTREILDAARLSFPELHHQLASIQGDRLGLGEIEYSSVAYADSSPLPHSASLDAKVLEALKHPPMWRALLNLENTVRLDAIQGETRAVYCLAHEFLKWFHWKLTLRQQRFEDLHEETLIEILRSIATYTCGTRPHSRDEDWRAPACEDGRMSGNEATTLYDEALSAGLIAEEARLSWRWRHMTVYTYLASGAQAGEFDG